MEVIDILMIVTLGVSLVDLALFGCCVWMGYQREKDRERKGRRDRRWKGEPHEEESLYALHNGRLGGHE